MSGAAPGLVDILTSWPVEPLAWLALLGTAVTYEAAYRKIDRADRRGGGFFVAGLLSAAFAIASPLHTFAGDLLWVHMTQHLILTAVSAPLLVLGSPLALALGAATSERRASSAEWGRRLRVDVLLHPLVAWTLFAVGMWLVHFSPIYDAAARNDTLHAVEHAFFLGIGLLFWTPVCSRLRALRPPLRVAYLLAALPQQSFLGLAIYSASSVLYPHYADPRAWGPSALDDQRIAGMVMWIGGDALFIAALLIAIAVWMREEEASDEATIPQRDAG